MKTDVLIAGAGIAGLSCAWHLQRAGGDYLLVEKAAVSGGLCGSVEKDGYTFDWSGHLLHLHSDYGAKFVKDLLGSNLSLLKRDARIFSHGVYTSYPFQASLYGLPESVVSDCVSGFIDACEKDGTPDHNGPFDLWAQTVFGTGICRHFMWPYNEKLWRVPLDRLTARWCGPFVPRPKLDEVLRGAYWPLKKKFGYNTAFYYPKRGGINALCSAIGKTVRPPLLGSALKRVDLKKKIAFVEGIGEVHYKTLVSTLPLKELAGMLVNPPASVIKAAEALSATSVHVLNIGARDRGNKFHWAYFPDKKLPFYRAGIASNFSKKVAPEGHASFYVETATAPTEKFNRAKTETAIIDGLVKSGFIKSEADIRTTLWLDIGCAYVIYDAAREKSVGTIAAYLEKNSCRSIGRYGGWKYSFMEEAVLEGRAAAEVALQA